MVGFARVNDDWNESTSPFVGGRIHRWIRAQNPADSGASDRWRILSGSLQKFEDVPQPPVPRFPKSKKSESQSRNSALDENHHLTELCLPAIPDLWFSIGNLLDAPKGKVGPARLDFQYLRTNIYPLGTLCAVEAGHPSLAP